MSLESTPVPAAHMAAELASQPETWARAAALTRRAGPAARARRAHRRRRLRHLVVHGAVLCLAPRDRRARRDRRVRGIRGVRRPRLRRGRRAHPLGHHDRGAPARRAPARPRAHDRRHRRRRHRRSSTSSTTPSRCRSPTSSRSCRPASPPRRWRSSGHRSARTSTRAIADARAAVADDLDPALVDAEQFTFLGRGWSVGLAHEAALKMREASQSWTESYPSMEYRHGPISIAAPGRVTWQFGEAPEGLARMSRPRVPGSRPVRSTPWPNSCARSASRSSAPAPRASTPTSRATSRVRSSSRRDSP